MRLDDLPLEYGAATLQLRAHAALALQLQALRQHGALQAQHARALCPQCRPRVRGARAHGRQRSRHLLHTKQYILCSTSLYQCCTLFTCKQVVCKFNYIVGHDRATAK